MVSVPSLPTAMRIEVNRLSSSHFPISASACQATTVQRRAESAALCFRPPQFPAPPMVHASTAMCAARLLLPPPRPVSFSPPSCALQFPSPSRLYVTRSSTAAARARRRGPPRRPPEQPPARLRPHLPERCPGNKLTSTSSSNPTRTAHLQPLSASVLLP
jgi:hypothetical protein